MTQANHCTDLMSPVFSIVNDITELKKNPHDWQERLAGIPEGKWGRKRDFFLTHSPNIIQYSFSESSCDDSCWLSAWQNHLGDGPLLMLGGVGILIVLPWKEHRGWRCSLGSWTRYVEEKWVATCFPSSLLLDCGCSVTLSLSFCLHDFPAVMGCNLERWVKKLSLN